MKGIINVGSDFSGVGAFDQALRRLDISYKTIFSCDWDKYARQTYIHNYGEPDYYPCDVYEREIPADPLHIYMTSPPCQAFSIAGKRKGEEDKRGILFYNSLDFIAKNKPKMFIFENVKGLLSDDGGRTFGKWVELLGGKSVNGQPVLFPHGDSVPYHIYWSVLNAKDYGIPQNRERVFIVGFKNEKEFRWPVPVPLEKCIADVLEPDVYDKYWLSEKMLDGFKIHADRHNGKGNGFAFEPKDVDDVSSAITTGYGTRNTDTYIKAEVIQVNESKESDGKQPYQQNRVYDSTGVAPTIGTSNAGNVIIPGRIIGRNPDNPKSRQPGLETVQMFEANENPGVSNTLATVEKDNLVYVGCAVHPFSKKMEFDGFKDGPCPTLLATDYKAPKTALFSNHRIRRFTPRECFRLMDFPDTFTWPVSDSQAYKQDGNSIAVGVLVAIIRRMLD